MAVSADYITNFRTRMEARGQSQRRIDQQALDLYLQKHVLDVQESKDPAMAVKAVGSGEGGFAVDQRVAVLSGPLVIKVAPRGGERAERHASDTLEPYLNLAFSMLENDVIVRQHVDKDIVLYGEAITLGPLPAPFFWGDSVMKELLEKGDLDAIEEYKAGNLPIVWRHLPIMDCWTENNDKGEPKELIYVREMYHEDIAARWGPEALPKKGMLGFGTGYKDSEMVEVIDYVNEYCISTVVGKKDSTQPLYHEHHMGTTPVCSFPGNLLPVNRLGLRRAGVLFHAREMLHARDETLTDLRTVIRENTTAPPVVYLNLEERSAESGWPTTIDVEPGKTVNMLIGERADRYPVPQMTVDGYQFLGRTDQYTATQLYREGLTGEGPSGQSAVHLNETNQIAKAELQTYRNGQTRGYTRAARLLLRCPQALNAYNETYFDRIVVRGYDAAHQSKEVGVSPKDVVGWEPFTSASLKYNLPVNEGLNVVNYERATKSRMLDPYTARERYGDIHNPTEVDDRWAEYELHQAVVADLIQVIRQRASEQTAQVGAMTPEQIAAESANLPAFAQETIGKLNGRVMHNESRTGVPQNMSQLSANGTEVPEAGPAYG